MARRLLATLALALSLWGSSGAEIHPAVDMSMKIQNLSYDLLVADAALLDEFVGRMKEGIVDAANHSVGRGYVWLSLSRGSGFLWVTWSIVPPTGVSVTSVRAALLREGTDRLLAGYALNMTGLSQAAVGSLAVEHVTQPRIVIEAPMPPSPTPAPVDFQRYADIAQLEDCNVSDFEIPHVDMPQEVVVWMAYLAYIVMLALVAGGTWYCCMNICIRKLRKRVMVFEEEEEVAKRAPDVGESKAPVAPEDEDAEEEEEEEEFRDLLIDVAAAEKHLAATSVTDAQGKWRSVFFTRIGEMSEIGGNGTELYFRLLRILGFTFFFMAGIVAPSAVIDTGGDFAPDIGGEMVKTTIGNLGFREDGGLAVQESRFVTLPLMGCRLIHATVVTKFFAWFDFGASLVFLTVIAYFRFHLVPATVQISERESITCRDYTVEVDQLPPEVEDQRSYERLFREHLMKCFRVIEEQRQRRQTQARCCGSRGGEAFEAPPVPPEICEVVLVRNFNGRLGAVKSRAELFRKLRVAEFKKEEKAVEKLSQQIDKLSLRLKEQLKPEEELPVVRAYVTLNTPGHARDLAHHYRFSVNACFRRCQFEGRRFFDRALRVRKAPEPSNIIWENQDLGYWNRMVRKAVTTITFFLLIFISMALIYAALVGSRTQANSSLNYLGDDACDPVSRDASGTETEVFKCMVHEAELWTPEEAQASPERLECWCLTQGYTKIFLDDVVGSVCTPWLQEVAKKIGIMALASIIVMLINIILQVVLVWLAEMERSSSISGKDSSIMFKIAVAQTLNTGAVPLIVNYSAPQALQDIVKVIPGLQFVGQGDYSDFVRGWYTVVGLALLVNMLANAFTPALQNLFWSIFTPAWRWCCTRKRCIKNYAQTELLELYTNPVFDISTRYATLIMTVFVTLMYSSGLPLLNLFAALYMFCMYWVDKYMLLRASKRPPFYDTQMPSKASEAMIYAVPLHCFFAIMMFGQPCTFPSNPLGGHLGSLSGSLTSSSSNTASYRITRETTWMIFGLLLVFVACWTVWTVLWALALDTVWRYVKRAICGAGGTVNEDHENLQWDKAKVHINRSYPPASYRLEHSMDFKKLAMFLSGGDTFANSMPGGWRRGASNDLRDAAKEVGEREPGVEDEWPSSIHESPPQPAAPPRAPGEQGAVETCAGEMPLSPDAEAAEISHPGMVEANRHSEEPVFPETPHVESDLAVDSTSEHLGPGPSPQPGPRPVVLDVDREVEQLEEAVSTPMHTADVPEQGLAPKAAEAQEAVEVVGEDKTIQEEHHP